MKRVLMWALLALGVVRMVADGLGLGTLAAVAAATGAAPAPKVFSAVQGLETYSTEFSLEWRGTDGGEHSLALTPEVYARVRGPYNRRNVFGAVLAYGPVLATNDATRPMYASVARYALCGEAPLLRELGVDRDEIDGPVRVRLEPKHVPPDLPLVLEAPCE